MVMEFLEHYKVTPQGLAIAIDYHWNGRTLETIVNDDEAHAMLRDDLGIGSKLNRLALIAAVKEYSMPATVPEKATTIGELIPQSQQRRLLLAGEKALEIPTIPVAAPGYSLPNHSSWKTFMTSVQGWSELESQDYSYVINCINRCPNQELDRLSTLLSDLDMRMYLVLGTHLFNKASAQLKKEFVQQEDYMLLYEGNHRLSGMKIIAFLGRKIVRQSTAKWLTLNREFTKRPPVYKMADLYKEINIILSIKDDLSNQDQCVEEATFFAVLHNAISELIEIPQLIVPFAYQELRKESWSPWDTSAGMSQRPGVRDHISQQVQGVHSSRQWRQATTSSRWCWFQLQYAQGACHNRPQHMAWQECEVQIRCGIHLTPNFLKKANFKKKPTKHPKPKGNATISRTDGATT
jgi:hypothetical protein